MTSGGPGAAEWFAALASEPENRAALFDLFVANAPAGLALLDRDFRYLVINDVLAEGHGRSVAAHLGRTVAEAAPHAWANLRPVYERVLEGERILNVELTQREVSETDERRLWLASFYPVRVGDHVIGVGIVANDVTDLKATQSALEVRTRLYEMLAHTNQAVSRARSAADLLTEVCHIAVTVGGFALAWIGVPHGLEVDVATHYGAGAYLEELHVSVDPDDPDSRGPTGRTLLTGEPQVVNDFLRADMTVPWHRRAAQAGLRSSASFPIREGGRVVAALGLYSTQVDHFTPDLIATLSEIAPILSYALDHFADERLREADEARLRTHDRALRSITQGVVITEAREDRPIIYASPSFLELTGYEESEVLGRSSAFLDGPETSPEAVDEVHRAVAEERECTVELVNYRKDGTPFWNRLTVAPVLDDRGRATHFVGVNTDVTASRELERQFLQSQKLEALGTLAGGIAHDFNNMLLVIRGYSGLLAQRLDEGDLREMARRIDAAVERAAEFTRRLLTFSRSQMIYPRPTDLSEVVHDTLQLLERMIGEDVVVTAELEPDLAPVVIDRAQFEQAILNLVTNARDAMPDEGTLNVRTALANLDQSYAELHPEVSPGLHVMLQITDSGVGMDEATQSRVFEPFFTTKANGTGLGLSTVYGIVRRCGGHVRFYSEPGTGTTFKIYLPVATGALEERAVVSQQRESLEGGETILVVEDVDEARDLVSHHLARLGYTVVVASNGLDALGVAGALDRPIDVLVTDIVMPRMNGRDLALRLLEVRPEVSVVFTSGFPSVEYAASAPFAGRSVFLEKPYVLDDIARAIRDLVDGPFVPRDAVKPLLDAAAMRAADADAVARVGGATLVHRAGTAVAQECHHLLGSLYGRRIAVVAGPGLNGGDGRVAARWLAARGARVDLVEVADQPARLVGYDLVVDAAFGLGCSRPYGAPEVLDAPVVAVDLPSGVDADTGALLGAPPAATLTVALGALKPAHLTGPGAARCGVVVLHELGIVGCARDGLVEDDDLADFVVATPGDHKWRHAVAALVGSALMPGAARLVATGALAGGASMVRLASRAEVAALDLPTEVVRVNDATIDLRCRAVVAGPGLGPDPAAWLAPALADARVPVVLDADALVPSLIDARPTNGPAWILTPHEGEFARLTGEPVPEDRLAATRDLARRTKCVVLLKGPITVIAAPDGTTRVVTAGTPGLATAGTGDVLAGLIAGALARGHDPLEAAALAAHLHGRAGARLDVYGTASDLPALARRVIADLAR